MAEAVPVGTHCILELHGCPAELLDDVQFVEESLVQAAQHARSRLLSKMSWKFQPQGVTAVALLAESHLAIHTWPERGYSAVDVFTCGRKCRPRAACRYLIRRLQARSHHLRVIRRGDPTGLKETAPHSTAFPGRALATASLEPQEVQEGV